MPEAGWPPAAAGRQVRRQVHAAHGQLALDGDGVRQGCGDPAAAAHIVHTKAQILQRDALGGHVELTLEADGLYRAIGKRQLLAEPGGQLAGPRQVDLDLAVGGRCGGVHRPVEADRAAGDAQFHLDRAGLAGSHALRPGHGAGQGGTLAVHGDPAVKLDRLVGTGLVDRKVDRFGVPVQFADTVVEGDHATFDPNVAEDETGYRRGSRGLIRCCFALSPAPEIPVPPTVLADLQIELRPRHHQVIDLDPIVAPEGQEVDAGIERLDPRQRVCLAPIGIGDPNVGGRDRHRRPGAQPERLAERDLPAGCHRGASLDRPFLQRRRDEQEARDRDDREQENDYHADQELAHEAPHSVSPLRVHELQLN